MCLHKLCYNCFRGGHIARPCYSKSSCTVSGCKLKHHTLLHREMRAAGHASEASELPKNRRKSDTAEDPAKANHVYAGVRVGSPVYLNIVPVNVYPDGKMMQTYAFLDQGSSTTLCNQRLLEKLGVSGEEVEFSLTTINKHSERRIDFNVHLSVIHVDGGSIVDLPNVISVDHLPVSQNQLLGFDHQQRWPQLPDV